MPPFIIFNDATLRDMARRRPGSEEALLTVHGVGRRKLKDLGSHSFALVCEYATRRQASRPEEQQQQCQPHPSILLVLLFQVLLGARAAYLDPVPVLLDPRLVRIRKLDERY